VELKPHANAKSQGNALLAPFKAHGLQLSLLEICVWHADREQANRLPV